jgi:hypothetical protein
MQVRFGRVAQCERSCSCTLNEGPENCRGRMIVNVKPQGQVSKCGSFCIEVVVVSVDCDSHHPYVFAHRPSLSMPVPR